MTLSCYKMPAKFGYTLTFVRGIDPMYHLADGDSGISLEWEMEESESARCRAHIPDRKMLFVPSPDLIKAHQAQLQQGCGDGQAS